jgi:hypothetical protein
MMVAVSGNNEQSRLLPDARIKPDGARENSPGCDIETTCTLQFGNAREALSEED